MILVTPGRHRAVKKPTRGDQLPDQVPCNSIKKSYGQFGVLDLGSGRFGLGSGSFSIENLQV
jgi:hypothetical protein